MAKSGGSFKPGQSGNPAGKWQKGQSANPGGRSKTDTPLRELVRTYTEEAIEKLVYLMRKAESEQTQYSAATHLLDRAYGKPRQALEHSGEGGDPIQVADVSRLSPVEREQRLLAIRRALTKAVDDDS